MTWLLDLYAWFSAICVVLVLLFFALFTVGLPFLIAVRLYIALAHWIERRWFNPRVPPPIDQAPTLGRDDEWYR